MHNMHANNTSCHVMRHMQSCIFATTFFFEKLDAAGSRGINLKLGGRLGGSEPGGGGSFECCGMSYELARQEEDTS